MQAFPDDFLLRQETLVCDQEVQLTLKENTTRYVRPPSSCISLEVTGDMYSFVYAGKHRIYPALN